MKLRRWGRVFSSILVLSFLLAGFVFPMLGSRVEASAQNARMTPIAGTSVSVENYSFFGGVAKFDLRLSGCSDYQSADLSVTFSRNCAIPNGGRNAGYHSPSISSNSTAYFTDRKTLKITTIDRYALKGENVISVEATVNQEVTVSSAEVTAAVPKSEVKINQEYTINGDPQWNCVSFGYYNMRGTVEMKVTKIYEKSGKDVAFEVYDGGNTINIYVKTKDLSPLTDMTICMEIVSDGETNLGLNYPNYSYISPTPTPIPTSTPTPIPTSTPTPEPTATPTPMPIVETTVETTVAPTATPKPTITPTPVPETSETSEETTSEETSETEPLVIAPVTSETEPSDTEPSEEPTTSETKKAVVRASASSDDSTDYSTYILLGILFILVILVYLRYSHLAKKEMPFPEICKNFIPVGAVVEKVKSLKKAKEPDPDEPKPEVMNGYLQKPTVGAAAARAVRPVRSNVSGTENQPKTENAEKTEQKPASDSPAPQRPGRRAMATNTDPALAEMERRQKIMEQEMNQLFSNKNKMKTDLPNESGEGSVPND